MNAPIVDMVLCGANLFGFSPGLDQRQREDWLHSNLLAQLAADKEYPQRAPGWREQYEQTLGYLSWMLEKTQAITARIPASTQLTVSALLMEQLPGLLTEPQRLTVASMLQRLSRNIDSPLSTAMAARMCLAEIAEPPADDQDELSEKPRAEKKPIRVALSLSVALTQNQLLTLQLDYATHQALDRDWLDTPIQPECIVGDVAFRYTAWLLSNYASNRKEVDEHLGKRIATHILPWPPMALPDRSKAT